MMDNGSKKGEKFTFSNDILSRLNSKNAKIIAFIVLLIFVIYHSFLHALYGNDSCKWLLSDGRFQGGKVWQPYGCMMHKYSQSDSRTCMTYIAYWSKDNHIVFVGDSRVRQLYQGIVAHMSTETVDFPVEKHQDHKWEDPNIKLKVEFIWSPFPSNMSVYFNKILDKKLTPSVIIVGSASWYIKSSNGSMRGYNSYNTELKAASELMNKIKKAEIKLLWILQDPVVAENLSQDRSMITNELIDLYNKAAIEIFSPLDIEIWSSSRLVYQGLPSPPSIDGLHINSDTISYDLQIFLNMYCNDHMNYNDGTCCSNPEKTTALQKITLGSLLSCVILFGIWWFICHGKKTNLLPQNNASLSHKGKKEINISDLLYAFGKLGLIMSYFYLCDRTNFFMKENKYYTELNFWLPIGYVVTLGLFFSDESKMTKVLHRDQTDEWKGWMQLVILIYHMTGASRVIPIYMHLRVIVSAYLFLTGYGHFCYFWQRGDGGLVRVVQVLFRMNFLTVTLCLCMNRPYQFYYFVPLVSFWYLVIVLFLIIPPQITATSCENNPIHYLYIIVKFVGLFSFITILYMSEVFFEKIFVTRPWKALFVTVDDDIHEWWFRWSLDRYSVFYGMVFAFFYQISTKYSIIDDNNQSNLFSRGITMMLILGSLIGVGGFTTFAFLCKNKFECNEVHPYVVFIPILGWILLRNVSGTLRTRFSTFFAWFGKISLELFIGQYHIWLAADTHGVLVLVPSYPVANVIVTSFIFVCIAHEISSVTSVVASFAVPSDWKYALRNIIIFFLVLIPIGIHDGMF